MYFVQPTGLNHSNSTVFSVLNYVNVHASKEKKRISLVKLVLPLIERHLATSKLKTSFQASLQVSYDWLLLNILAFLIKKKKVPVSFTKQIVYVILQAN